MPPPLKVQCSSWSHNRQTTIPWRNETAGGFPPVILFAPMLPDNSPRTAAEKGFQQENGRPSLPLWTPRPSVSQTSVTSTPIFFSALRSDLGIPWSVITSCKATGGTISDKLLRPNLLESHTATVRLATSTITRFTFASRRLGVLRPLWTSKPS